MERGWRIAEWSRELGRGRIASEAGTLDFDASVALVDDFVSNELVDIVLEGGVVRRIQPRSARSLVAPIESALSPEWTASLDALNAKLDLLTALVLADASSERVRIEVQHSEWPNAPARCVATFEYVDYIQLPLYATDFAKVTARTWTSVRSASPSFLDAFPIDIDGVDPDRVLVCFEPDDFGAACGFLIARSLHVDVS